MKKLLLSVLILALLSLPLAALAADVSSWDELKSALEDPAVDSVTVVAPMAIPESVIINKPVVICVPNGVNDFVIEPDVLVTLGADGVLSTVSSFDDNFFINRISVQGILDANKGQVLAGTFFVENPGALLLFNLDTTEDIVVDHLIASQEDLLRALDDDFCGAIVLQDDPETGEGAMLILDQPIELKGELYITAAGGFVCLRIVEGGALTLDEEAVLGTTSDFNPELGVFAIGQVWLDGGVLDISQGEVWPYSTVYMTDGTLILSESTEEINFVAGALSEESLREHMARGYGSLALIQANFALTQDLELAYSANIQDDAVLTVDGCTLTVPEGVELVIGEGSGLINNGRIVNHGVIIVESGAVYEGAQPEGNGDFEVQ